MEADTNLRTVGCRLEAFIPDAQTKADISYRSGGKRKASSELENNRHAPFEFSMFENNKDADIHSVQELHVSRGGESGFDEDVWSVVQRKFRKDRPKMVVILARDTRTNKPLGFALMSSIEVSVTKGIVFAIENLIVANSVRRKGLGADLVQRLQFMISKMRDTKLPDVHVLFVIKNSPWSIEFWKRMGYKIMGNLPAHFKSMEFYLHTDRLEPWTMWKEV